jgi:hypothetical protein
MNLFSRATNRNGPGQHARPADSWVKPQVHKSF